MISDNDLYRLAMFLGYVAMLLIVLYHFLEVNARDSDDTTVVKTVTPVSSKENETVIKATTNGEKITIASSATGPGAGSGTQASAGKKGR